MAIFLVAIKKKYGLDKGHENAYWYLATFLYYYKYWLTLVKIFHDWKRYLYLSALLKTYYKLSVIQDMIKTQKFKVKLPGCFSLNV